MILSEILLIIFIIILNILFIIFFDKIKLFKWNIDKPDNYRKLHKKPTPLAGGTIIFVNLSIFFIFSNYDPNILKTEIIFNDKKNILFFFTIASLIFFLGFVDDKFNIAANSKFLLLLFIFFIVVNSDSNLIIKEIKLSFFEQNYLLSEINSKFFTIFCFIVFLNAFNMFDGINLQSSFYTIILLLCILIFYSDLLIVKIILISIVSHAFLNFNDRSFLGDSGSLLMAFIISYIFIKLYNTENIKTADEIVIYMLLPGIDLIRVFFRRLLSKKNPLTPDKFHFHHLLIAKYSWKTTIAIMILFVSVPIIMNYFKFNQLFIIIFFIVTYSSFLYLVSLKK